MDSFSKTENPTAKKIAYARKKGDVAFSPFFAKAFHFFGIWLFFWQAKNLFASAFMQSLNKGLLFASDTLIDPYSVLYPWILPLTLLLILSFLLTICAYLLQSGLLWVSPYQRKKNSFKSSRECFFLIMKCFAFGCVAFFACRKILWEFSEKPLPMCTLDVFQHMMKFSGWIILGTLGIGAFDWVRTLYFYKRRLLMSRQELVEEKREREGNEQTKKQVKKLFAKVAK